MAKQIKSELIKVKRHYKVTTISFVFRCTQCSGEKTKTLLKQTHKGVTNQPLLQYAKESFMLADVLCDTHIFLSETG